MIRMQNVILGWREMTYRDYEIALGIIDQALFKDPWFFGDRLQCARELQLLNLTKTECIRLYEYIERHKTEFNTVCLECENACTKSVGGK